eukprot:GHUV01054756.1.p1 GENE.GHUV01054756.1~~GHUV01054756.1.p1  ORF type:complete len:108 (-),score=29.70 GHUV01054756.1:8-331(-)
MTVSVACSNVCQPSDAVQVHQHVIQRITAGIEAYGFKCHGVTESPLKGDKGGNTEFLALFKHHPEEGPICVPPDGVRDEGGDLCMPVGSSSGGSSSGSNSSTDYSSS